MEKSLKSIAANYGLYLGAFLSLITVFAYSINIELFVNSWFGISLMLLIIIMGIIAVAKVKQSQQGFASFKECFTAFFIAILTALLISNIVYFILFNVIDSEAAITLKEITIEKTVKMLEKFNTSNDIIAKSVEQIESQNQFSLVNILKSLVGNLVLYSIIGLIVAAAMKKNNPATE